MHTRTPPQLSLSPISLLAVLQVHVFLPYPRAFARTISLPGVLFTKRFACYHNLFLQVSVMFSQRDPSPPLSFHSPFVFSSSTVHFPLESLSLFAFLYVSDSDFSICLMTSLYTQHTEESYRFCLLLSMRSLIQSQTHGRYFMNMCSQC